MQNLNGSPISHAAAKVTILEAGRGARDYWRDLWRYRDLFVILAWRDISVRYKQTVMAFAWAVLRPLLTMIVFSAIFAGVAHLPGHGVAPYPLLVLAGMLPWFLFSSILSEASNSLLGAANLIGKVYFPRLIAPAAVCGVALVDFLVNLVLLLGLLALWGIAPGWRLLLLPAFVALAVLASLGPALIFAALNVQYRDFRYISPFLAQFGMYVSPVGFSSEAVPEPWRFWYSLNPMVGVIDGFRWCLLGGDSRISAPAMCASLTLVALTLWLGIVRFRRIERVIADLL